MKYIKAYKLFEANGPLEPGKWSWTKDLTIPRDMQMDIYDMSFELRDEGYTVSYQWWPPYEKGNKLYKDNKYPHINITKRVDTEGGLEKIYYGWIEDFCQRIVSYLDEKEYNAVIKYRKLNSNEYFDIKDSVMGWGPFGDKPMANSIHFRIEMISRKVYGDVYESTDIDTIVSRESRTRTKSLSEEEFLEIIRTNCKNFSFMNDLLWRKSNKDFGQLGLFLESERKATIGKYNYHTFFDLRKEYPVPRYKSLIGSTTEKGAEYFGSDTDLYMVIPFDNSQIVFAGSPDLALWSKSKEDFSDRLFIMKEYTKNFEVPVDELTTIRDASTLSSWSKKLPEFGFEFFISSPCLLIHKSKVNWLRNNL